VSEAALIWCPFADGEAAHAAAEALLDEGLVACANILPPIHSLYSWQGERGEASEVGVLFKTHASLLARAVERLEALHGYEAPAIVGWRADACGAATAEWLANLAGAGE
jgi:periplasmic divalent cation tolerance protein